MTDELLLRRLREQDEYNKRHYERDPLHEEAADRIEALTAKVAELEACLERQGSGHREDLDEIANVSVERLRRAEAAEAERDRLREALVELVQQTHNCERELTEDLHHVDFCGESVPLTNAREALKGGGHE